MSVKKAAWIVSCALVAFAARADGASVVVRWTGLESGTEQISLLPIDVALPPGWTRERALTEWTRPATDGEQRWDSLPEGTYQIVLRAGTVVAGAAVPHDLGELVVTKDEHRIVRVTLPTARSEVTTRSLILRIPAPRNETERLVVSHWHGAVRQELTGARTQTTAGILLNAHAPCTRGDAILVESSGRIGVATLDPPCAQPIDVTMHERVPVTVSLAFPRGTKSPAGGIIRLSRCESSSTAIDVPFAVIRSRVQTGIPARCSEASLHVDGFAPVAFAPTVNGDVGPLQLKPGAAAVLRVRARRDARPLAGVRVYAVRAHQLRAMRNELAPEQVALESAVTDAAGWTRLVGLPEEEIVFLLAGAARTNPQVSEPYVLRAGEETVIEDVLFDEPANVFAIVSVPDTMKTALELDSVELRPAVHNPWPPQIAIRGVLSESGATVRDVPAGAWTVRATGRLKNGYVVRLAQTSIDVLSGIDRHVTLSVTEKLYRGRVIRGDSGVSGVLNLKHTDRRSGIPGAVAALGADGAFAVLLERSGKYSAHVQDTTGSGVMLGKHVAFDDPDQEISIELPAGRIQGRVIDGTGAPVAGALVSATQQFAEPRTTSFARNQPDGAFTLENIGAGSWEIVAETSGGRSESASVSFDESDPEGVILVLEPTERVTVHVVDGTGTPVRDAFVTVEFPRAGSPPSKTYIQTTGGDGGAGFRLSRAERSALTNVVVATTDLRLSCALRRLDRDQTLTIAGVGGEVRLVGRQIPPGAQAWLVSSSGCGVPFLGTRVETEKTGERTVVFPRLAAGTWSYVETRNGEEVARLLTGRAATLTPLETFSVESGKSTRVILDSGTN